MLLNATYGNGSQADPEAWRMNVPGSGNYTKASRNQATIFIAVIYPLLLTLCTVGNTLNLFVLASRKKKKTTTYYMIAMAIVDIMFLWFSLPIQAYNISFALNLPYKTEANKIATMAVRPYVIWAQEWSIQMCDWVLLIFSAERLVSVLKPFGFQRFHQPHTAQIIIVALIPLSGAFTVFNFVDNYLRSKVKKGFKDDDGMPSWLLKWRLLQVPAELAMVLFKFFGLLIMNLTLISAIKSQQNSEISKQRVAQMAKVDQRYRSSNIILISSAALYLFSWFPTVVYNCLDLADALHMYSFEPSAKALATPIVQGIAYINYSINFFLYLTVSKAYRMEFSKFFTSIFCSVWCLKTWRRNVKQTLPVATELTSTLNTARRFAATEDEQIGSDSSHNICTSADASRNIPRKLHRGNDTKSEGKLAKRVPT